MNELKLLVADTWRQFLGTIGGGAAAIIVAGNWVNPNNPYLGSLLAVSGVTLGTVGGALWTLRAHRREESRCDD